MDPAKSITSADVSATDTLMQRKILTSLVSVHDTVGCVTERASGPEETIPLIPRLPNDPLPQQVEEETKQSCLTQFTWKRAIEMEIMEFCIGERHVLNRRVLV